MKTLTRTREDARTRFSRDMLNLEGDLHRLALSLSANEPDARDLVQTTFVKGLRNWKKFKPGTNLRAWLSRILRNTFIDGRRRQAYTPASIDFQEGFEPAQKVGNDDISREEVAVALERLDAKSRALLVLCDIEGYAYREIADLLGRPLGTVMSGIHRARRKLREALTSSRAMSVSGKRTA
jgi:RNA polymerase sigma-70 factor (ECF subfamily)